MNGLEVSSFFDVEGLCVGERDTSSIGRIWFDAHEERIFKLF